jgi:hypothetical protein
MSQEENYNKKVKWIKCFVKRGKDVFIERGYKNEMLAHYHIRTNPTIKFDNDAPLFRQLILDNLDPRYYTKTVKSLWYDGITNSPELPEPNLMCAVNMAVWRFYEMLLICINERIDTEEDENGKMILIYL